MGVTAKRLIDQAASKIGVKGRGKDLAPDELMDFLVGMKNMLDGWSLEHLMIPYRTRETFALSEQQGFTWGTGGDFDSERPISIVQIEIIDLAGETYPVACKPLNSFVMARDDVVARPHFAYWEDGYPLGTLYFDRIPYDPTVRIWSLKPIAAWQVEDLSPTQQSTTTVTQGDMIEPLTLNGQPVTVDDTPVLFLDPTADGITDVQTVLSDRPAQSISTESLTLQTALAEIEFDRGYENAIIFNLAVYMAPDYDKMPSPLVLQMAENYKRNIKRQNLHVPELTYDPQIAARRGGRRYDIYDGPGDQ